MCCYLLFFNHGHFMEKYTGENILDFTDQFRTHLNCLEYLAKIK